MESWASLVSLGICLIVLVRVGRDAIRRSEAEQIEQAVREREAYETFMRYLDSAANQDTLRTGDVGRFLEQVDWTDGQFSAAMRGAETESFDLHREFCDRAFDAVLLSIEGRETSDSAVDRMARFLVHQARSKSTPLGRSTDLGRMIDITEQRCPNALGMAVQTMEKEIRDQERERDGTYMPAIESDRKSCDLLKALIPKHRIPTESRNP